MKLEFEVIPQNSFNSHQFADNGEQNPKDIEEMLNSGVKCAKDGNRAEARRLLQRVAEIAPENETAWMWLASLSEYPEELLGFLNNVLKINPNNERAVEWAAATKSLLAKTFVERGINASQENRKEIANRCFMQALAHDEQNELAWLSLASNADTLEEKTEYLQKVLSINPENETATASLKSVKHEISEQLLKKANFAAISGERETARQLLEEAMQDAPELEEAWILKAYIADDSEEKIACYEKILALNPENEAAQAGLTSLKMLLQKNSEPKFSVEAIKEILESTQNEFSAQEQSTETAPETESFNNFDNNFELNAVEDASSDFVSDAPENNHCSSDLSESPTDELNADFIEEIKSRGGFSEAENFAPDAVIENRFDSSVLEEAPAQNENQSFETFNQAENFDDSRPTEEFQTFESSDFEQISDSSGETDGFFEIEVSDSDNLSNIFGSEDSAEQSGVEDESLLFEVSSETVLPESDSAFSLETGSEFSPEFTDVEDLPLVEELSPEESETVVSNKTPESLPESLNEEFSEISAAETREFSPEAVQEESGDKFSENRVSNQESRFDEAENNVQNASSPTDAFACPFCFVMNEPQAFVCVSCRTMFSLSDMEMLLSYNEAQPQVLEMAIEDLEAERNSRQLSETELTNLGIAYLNVKNLRKALACLQEAAQLNVNNVVLASKVNFLAIRVAEIEEHESKNEGVSLKNLTIMVVDDSATVRKLISGKLEKCGHTVVAAANGQEALSQLQELVPDLILLDIMMPEMDGYQVCKLIRSNEPTKEVPVIMISGKDGFFDKVRGRMAGTTGYITKPFGPETLMRTIETYVV